MKKKGRLVLIMALISAACCFFAFVYRITYKYTYEDVKNNTLYNADALKTSEARDTYVQVFKQFLGQLSKRQNKAPDEIVVTAKTIYIVEQYNEMSGMLIKEVPAIPIELLGLNAEGLRQYAEKKTEEENGRSSFEIVVFEQNLLVIRRTYWEEEGSYKFIIKDYEGMVTVYDCDDSSVYVQTNIRTDDLPEELRERVKEGIKIENEKDLFLFLESYNS